MIRFSANVGVDNVLHELPQHAPPTPAPGPRAAAAGVQSCVHSTPGNCWNCHCKWPPPRTYVCTYVRAQGSGCGPTGGGCRRCDGYCGLTDWRLSQEQRFDGQTRLCIGTQPLLSHCDRLTNTSRCTLHCKTRGQGIRQSDGKTRPRDRRGRHMPLKRRGADAASGSLSACPAVGRSNPNRGGGGGGGLQRECAEIAARARAVFKGKKEKSWAVGGWRLAVGVGGRLAAVGGWRRCWRRLAVGGWRSLGTVLQGRP